MAFASAVDAKFREVFCSRHFQSFKELQEAIKGFSKTTGYSFRTGRSNKYPVDSIHAEKFVYAHHKYVCIMAPTRKRIGCDAYFNVNHRVKKGIAVTSFNMDHNHEPMSHATVIFNEHPLQDFHTLSPLSPKADEQPLIVRSEFKRVMGNGIFNSYVKLMSRIRDLEEATNSNFRILHSRKLPEDHPAYGTIKYRYIYFACVYGGRSRVKSSNRLTKQSGTGCKARFTASEFSGELHVKSVYMLHNHACNRVLASAYTKCRRFRGQVGESITNQITQTRPCAGLLKVYFRNSSGISHKMKALAGMKRRILPSDPSAMAMVEALHNMRGGSLYDFMYGEKGLEAMCLTTPALKAMFAQYAKVVQMDGTYPTNHHGFALYHIMIIDKHGDARSVFYAFVWTETAETIEWVVRKFKELMNPATKEIQTVFLEKDALEISAWRRTFPEMGFSILIPTLYVLKAFRYKVSRLYPKEVADLAMRSVKKAVRTVSLSTYRSVIHHLEKDFPELWPYIQENWLTCERLWAHHARARVVTYSDDMTNKTEHLNLVLRQRCRRFMNLPDCVISLVAFLQSKEVDTEELQPDKCCRRMQLSGRPRHVAVICEMLTTYASEVFLKHLDANKGVESMSEWVDACSCRFFSNWELPCVHIVNCMAAKGVDPQLVVRGCRWLTISQRLDVPETNEDPDPQAVSSFVADVVLEDPGPASTEACRYRQAMELLDPLLEELKSCNQRRFSESLRKLKACVEEIISDTTSEYEDKPLSFSGKAEEYKGDVVEGQMDARCIRGREEHMLCAHVGIGRDQPVLVSHNDRLLPISIIRGRSSAKPPAKTSQITIHSYNTAANQAGGSTPSTLMVRRATKRGLSGSFSDEENCR